jgi:hypothetical protein
LAASLLASVGCADGKKKHGVVREEKGPELGSIASATQGTGVDPRYLVTAAYVQSNFGADAARTEASAPEGLREPHFGMALAEQPRGTAPTLEARARVLAGKVKACAAQLAPKSPFDWLLCTAQSIVGEGESDPNVRDFQVRLVLLQLIDAWNNGFAVLVPGSTARDVVPPAPEAQRVDVKSLDAGRGRYVSGFRIDRDLAAEVFVPGNPAAEEGARATGNLPRVILRHCPGNALTCFDHFRRSRSTAVHFLAYRTSTGGLEMAQFHDLSKDLTWRGLPQEDAIVIALSGPAGVSIEASRADWYDWEDYVALRRVVIDVITKTARALRVDVSKSVRGASYDPRFLGGLVVEALREPTGAAVPKGAPAFTLPSTWDSGLFREILTLGNEPRLFGQIRVDAPTVGQVYEGNKAFFAFYPDTKAAEIQMYQDAPGAAGAPWDLILKRDYAAEQKRVDYSHEFRRKGVTGTNVRAVKIVSRDAEGRLLASRIVRFALSGIPVK